MEPTWSRRLMYSIRNLIDQIDQQTGERDDSGVLAEKVATEIISKVSAAEITKAIQEIDEEDL